MTTQLSFLNISAKGTPWNLFTWKTIVYYQNMTPSENMVGVAEDMRRYIFVVH